MGITNPGSPKPVTPGRTRVIIVGGAGFVGSHFTDALLANSDTERVTLYDNFASGTEWHYSEHVGDDRLAVVRADANDIDELCSTMAGHDLVVHLASNPDIAAAMTNPAVDFDDGTMITHHVVEAMRRTGVRVSHMPPAVASTAIWARPRPMRTMGRSFPSRPTGRASWPARR